MKKMLGVLLMALLIPGIAAKTALAGGGPFSVHLSGQGVVYLSGDAAHGDNSPDYDDVFKPGVGLNLEGAYRLNDKFSLLAGVGYENHSGDAFNGISFDDHRILPVYIGGKYHFGTEETRWRPYLRADIGFAHFDAVDISYAGSSAAYWGESWEFVADLGGGVEYRFNSWGIFVELKARYMDRPDGKMSPYSTADSSWSLPVSVGVSYYF